MKSKDLPARVSSLLWSSSSCQGASRICFSNCQLVGHGTLVGRKRLAGMSWEFERGSYIRRAIGGAPPGPPPAPEGGCALSAVQQLTGGGRLGHCSTCPGAVRRRRLGCFLVLPFFSAKQARP